MTTGRRLVLLGHPVARSLSPLMQNAALAAAGIHGRYEALDVPPERLDDTLARVRGERTPGNVTTPHKDRVAAACDRRLPLAERSGAVNTFWFDGAQMVGDNTDVGGFLAALAPLFGGPPEGVTFGVLGAGGAAAGVLTAIEQLPRCRAVVVNRTPQRAAELCARFSAIAQQGDVEEMLSSAQCVVNATRVGFDGDQLPIDVHRLAEGTRVFDLVYRIGETPWVRAARGRGLPATDGLAMLVEQGALAFTRWFGRSPDRDAMWAAIRQVDPGR